MMQQPQTQPGPPARSSGIPTWAIVLIVGGVVGLVILGIVGALALSGMRRYMAAAKSAEAKATVSAIGRSALSSYESTALESGTGRLCGSATPVPSVVPAGMHYMPAPSDFSTGSANEGWVCLRFTMTSSIRYQYHYNQGTGYRAASVSPGPMGFEAAAVGDIDKDGVLSTFASVGKIDSSGKLVLAKQVYIENEFE